MKRRSTPELESMHEVAKFIAGLRRRLAPLVPGRWLALSPAAASLRARRLSAARMEVDPAAPAASWAAWEISRCRPPARQAGTASEE